MSTVREPAIDVRVRHGGASDTSAVREPAIDVRVRHVEVRAP